MEAPCEPVVLVVTSWWVGLVQKYRIEQVNSQDPEVGVWGIASIQQTRNKCSWENGKPKLWGRSQSWTVLLARGLELQLHSHSGST